MTEIFAIINGRLHSPYFIFLRASNRFTDEDILRLLGVGDCLPHSPQVDCGESQIFLTEDEEWIHIADDWLYSLWHKGHKKIVETLNQSVLDATIFSCAVGDSDYSFEFSYYSSGKLLRRFSVENPDYHQNGRIVIEDFGQPLPLEKCLAEIDDAQDYVFSLAAGLGVNTNHKPEAIRCYIYPCSSLSDRIDL